MTVPFAGAPPDAHPPLRISTPATARPRRLTGRRRRFARLAHIIASCGWIGLDIAIGVLVVTALVSNEPGTVAASYTVLNILAVPLLLALGLTTLGTGLLLSVGSGLGVLRWWWVAVKLVINVILTSLVLIALRPELSEAAEQATLIDATLNDRLGDIPTTLLFPPIVSGVALLAAALLGTFKPWGRTPYGRKYLTNAKPAPFDRSAPPDEATSTAGTTEPEGRTT